MVLHPQIPAKVTQDASHTLEIHFKRCKTILTPVHSSLKGTSVKNPQFLCFSLIIC
jgi:hypothetical protein